jgi:outer membrane protein insertion porin family
VTRLLWIVLVAIAAPAFADNQQQSPWIDAARPPPPWRIVGFRAEGKTKTTDETIEFLSRYKIGSQITDKERARIERNLFSSELFESVSVRYEFARDGVIVVALLDDKHSWIVAPTLYILSTNYAVGFGFAENNLFGQNRKLLLYAQVGSVNSFFAGGYVVPQFLRNKLSMRVDVYLQRKLYQEYANPVNDPSNTDLARESIHKFLNLGAVLGWNVRWWLNLEVRLRGALVTYRDAVVPETTISLPPPSPDGYDITTQLRATVDRRTHRFGVTDGPYAQAIAEIALPGSDYLYDAISGRIWLAKRLPYEHMLQLRLYGNIGYHLPFHDEWTLGAATDLRGYPTEQFRGDVRALARLEYSVPIGRIRSFYFRALGFGDAGYIGYHFTDPSIRNYLPDQIGRGVSRSDAGGGVRIYFRNIVLPLLGLDIGYGFENRATATYLQVGLTDF